MLPSARATRKRSMNFCFCVLFCFSGCTYDADDNNDATTKRTRATTLRIRNGQCEAGHFDLRPSAARCGRVQCTPMPTAMLTSLLLQFTVRVAADAVCTYVCVCLCVPISCAGIIHWQDTHTCRLWHGPRSHWPLPPLASACLSLLPRLAFPFAAARRASLVLLLSVSAFFASLLLLLLQLFFFGCFSGVNVLRASWLRYAAAHRQRRRRRRHILLACWLQDIERLCSVARQACALPRSLCHNK